MALLIILFGLTATLFAYFHYIHGCMRCPTWSKNLWQYQSQSCVLFKDSSRNSFTWNSIKKGGKMLFLWPQLKQSVARGQKWMLLKKWPSEKVFPSFNSGTAEGPKIGGGTIVKDFLYLFLLGKNGTKGAGGGGHIPVRPPVPPALLWNDADVKSFCGNKPKDKNLWCPLQLLLTYFK